MGFGKALRNEILTLAEESGGGVPVDARSSADNGNEELVKPLELRLAKKTCHNSDCRDIKSSSQTMGLVLPCIIGLALPITSK